MKIEELKTAILDKAPQLQALTSVIEPLIAPYATQLEGVLGSMDIPTLAEDIIALSNASDASALEQNFTTFRGKYPIIESFIPTLTSAPEWQKQLENIKNEIYKLTPPLDDLTPEEEDKLPILNPTLPSVSVDSDRIQKLEEFKKELDEAIEANTSVLANTHFSLLGISELFSISKDMYAFYEYQINQLKISNDDYANLKAQLEQVSHYINNTILEVASLHKTSLRIFDSTESLLDEAKAKASEISASVDELIATKLVMEQIQAQIPELNSLLTQNKAIIEQAANIRDQINALVPNILADVRSTLLKDKENFEAQLEAKTNEGVAIFDEKLALLQNKLNEFETNWNTYNAKIQECYSRIELFFQDLDTKAQEIANTHNANLKELEDLTAQKSQEYNDNHTQKTQEFEALVAKESAKTLASVTDAKNLALSDISGALEVSKKSLSAHKDTLEQNLTDHKVTLSEDMTKIKDSYLAEIRNDIPAQVADLTQLVNEIKASNQALGTNFVSQTYTTSQSFTPIVDVKDYYVFVRGGTGGSNSSTRGGTTSFGSLLTATGGAGNPNGAGQVGESRAGFVSFSDEQVMSIASGGIIIVSYATK